MVDISNINHPRTKSRIHSLAINNVICRKFPNNDSDRRRVTNPMRIFLPLLKSFKIIRTTIIKIFFCTNWLEKGKCFFFPLWVPIKVNAVEEIFQSNLKYGQRNCRYEPMLKADTLSLVDKTVIKSLNWLTAVSLFVCWVCQHKPAQGSGHQTRLGRVCILSVFRRPE